MITKQALTYHKKVDLNILNSPSNDWKLLQIGEKNLKKIKIIRYDSVMS